MKRTSGRISVKNRQSIVEPVSAFAKSKNLSVNLVMSAVLFVGERLGGRMSSKALAGIINNETVATYQVELARRATALATQVNGLVKNALPKAIRTPENISAIVAKLPANSSVQAKIAIIATEVAALAPATV